MPYHDLRKGRFSQSGQAYHLTTVTHGREPFFADWQTACKVVQTMRDLICADRVESLAWVLMPDHLHWLFILHSDSMADIAKQLKGRSALAVNQHLARSGAVWQPNYHDHALRRDEDLRKTARYIVANPLRRGLVSDIGQYPLWDAVWL